MKEPKTIADAKRLTLQKIKKCMELPREERGYFWWYKNPCAFCLIYKAPCCTNDTKCIVKKECNWFKDNIEGKFYKKDLRKLYRMVEGVEG